MNAARLAWPEVSLGEVCEFKYGKSLSESARAGGKVPVFGSNGQVGSHNKALTKGATIIVGRKGSFGEVNFSRAPCWPIDTTYYVDESATKADLRWLNYRIGSLGLNRLNRAAAVPGLNREDAYRQRLLLPPLPEQRRIAAILDQADALRAKRRATLAKLDELAQSIFLDMFGDPAINPKGWPRALLKDAYWFQEGPGVRKWQFKSEGVKLLNVGNIESDGHLNLEKTSRFISEEEAYGKYRHFLVDAGDLVIASSGISFDADGLLRTRGAFVSLDHLPLCMNTSTIRFKEKAGKSDLRYLWVWLSSPEFRNQISKRVTGTAQQNFGPSHLSALSITLPPLSLQREFARRLRSIESTRMQHLDWLAGMDKCFASLQHRAFAGELALT